MQQEPVLFSGTVYENVACGLFGTDKANLSESEQRVLVEKACKDAYADEFIQRLPKVSAIPAGRDKTSQLLVFHLEARLISARAMILSLVNEL